MGRRFVRRCRSETASPASAWMLALLAVSWICGCAHTQPQVDPSYFQNARKNYQIGIAGLYDVNQFDYAATMLDEVQKLNVVEGVKLTPDLAVGDCDYVIRGHFGFYRVPTKNAFHYTSIYFFGLPLLLGFPNTNSDGEMNTSFEIYHKGALLKTYSYRDVFRDQRSYLTLWPELSADAELRRMVRLLLRDMWSDFFGYGRGA